MAPQTLKEVEFEYVNCLICGRDDTILFHETHDKLFGLPGKFKIVKCKNCSFVYLNPRPTQESIKFCYPEEYIPHKPFIESKLKRRLRKAYTRLFGGDPYSLSDLHKGRILDLGCGAGKHMKELKDNGWDTYGVDICANAIEQAKKLGLNAFVGEVREANFPKEYFDAILMKHTLEHMHSPLRNLTEVRRTLKKDGVLILSVPNIESLEFKLFGRHWMPIEAPRHLHHFSSTSLDSLLRKAGFTICKIGYETTPYYFVESINYLSNKKFGKILANDICYGLMYPLTFFISRILKKGATLVVYARKA